MKKCIYLVVILTVLTLTGCSKKDQMTNFIPTQAPEEDSVATSGDLAQGETQIEATPTPKVIHVGQTTPMYAKLDKYGAYLNIRSTPSTDGEQVGFLVHGEEIEVIEIADGWASFLYNDAICYVNADYLVDKQPEYLEPPTPLPTSAATPTPKVGKTPKAGTTKKTVTVKPEI